MYTSCAIRLFIFFGCNWMLECMNSWLLLFYEHESMLTSFFYGKTVKSDDKVSTRILFNWMSLFIYIFCLHFSSIIKLFTKIRNVILFLFCSFYFHSFVLHGRKIWIFKSNVKYSKKELIIFCFFCNSTHRYGHTDTDTQVHTHTYNDTNKNTHSHT